MKTGGTIMTVDEAAVASGANGLVGKPVLESERGQHPLIGRMRAELPTLIRYFGIGVSASIIDVGVFLLSFNAVGLDELASQSIAVGLAVIYSFVLNARFNFGVEDRLLARFAGFCGVAFVGYLVGFGVIVALREYADLSPNLGKMAGLPLVFVVQYFLNSRISFRSVDA